MKVCEVDPRIVVLFLPLLSLELVPISDFSMIQELKKRDFLWRASRDEFNSQNVGNLVALASDNIREEHDASILLEEVWHEVGLCDGTFPITKDGCGLGIPVLVGRIGFVNLEGVAITGVQEQVALEIRVVNDRSLLSELINDGDSL